MLVILVLLVVLVMFVLLFMLFLLLVIVMIVLLLMLIILVMAVFIIDMLTMILILVILDSLAGHTGQISPAGRVFHANHDVNAGHDAGQFWIVLDSSLYNDTQILFEMFMKFDFSNGIF